MWTGGGADIITDGITFGGGTFGTFGTFDAFGTLTTIVCDAGIGIILGGICVIVGNKFGGGMFGGGKFIGCNGAGGGTPHWGPVENTCCRVSDSDDTNNVDDNEDSGNWFDDDDADNGDADDDGSDGSDDNDDDDDGDGDGDVIDEGSCKPVDINVEEEEEVVTEEDEEEIMEEVEQEAEEEDNDNKGGGGGGDDNNNDDDVDDDVEEDDKGANGFGEGSGGGKLCKLGDIVRDIWIFGGGILVFGTGWGGCTGRGGRGGGGGGGGRIVWGDGICIRGSPGRSSSLGKVLHIFFGGGIFDRFGGGILVTIFLILGDGTPVRCVIGWDAGEGTVDRFPFREINCGWLCCIRCPLEVTWLNERLASGLWDAGRLVGDGLEDELCLFSELFSQWISSLLRSFLFSQSLFLSLFLLRSLSCEISLVFSSFFSSNFKGNINSPFPVPLLLAIFLNWSKKLPSLANKLIVWDTGLSSSFLEENIAYLKEVII